MKVLLIDDHALFREGICHVINRMEDPITILEASEFEMAVDAVSANSDLDLVLLDLNLSGKSGFDLLELFSNQYPALPIVILSASNLSEDAKKALALGAVGYIHKDTSSEIMLNALRMILAGGIYIPPNLVDSEFSATSDGAKNGLTPRQLQVLKQLADGQSNKVIASDLNLAEATVKMHVTAIFKCLGVSNRTQAALAADKLGLF